MAYPGFLKEQKAAVSDSSYSNEMKVRRSLSGFRSLVLRGLIFDPRFHSFLQQV
jgi:hypothetical protein